MNKQRIAAMVVCLVLVLLLLPVTASAGPESIGITAYLSPGDVGYRGGDVTLRANISNMNGADIDWVDFTINTATPQTKRWEGAQPIYAYSNGTASVAVHLSPEDLNKDLLVSVSVNFDIDANPDKVEILTVRADRIDTIVDFSAAPATGVFDVGDTVNVMHEMTNLIEPPIYNVQFQSFFLGNENQDLAEPRVSHYTSLETGEAARTSTSYTLTEADVGTVGAAFSVSFEFLGETYTISQYPYRYTVNEPIRPEFTATLSAPGGEPALGDTVDLRIDIRNTGNRGFGSFIVRDADGTRVATGGSAGPGETIHVSVPFEFAEYGEWDVTYTVIGDFGLDDLTRRTNSLHLALAAPPTETPMPPPTQAPASSPAAAETETPTEAPASAAPGESPIALEADTGTNQALLYIIIGVLGAVVLAGGVVLLLLLKKRKRSEPKQPKPKTKK